MIYVLEGPDGTGKSTLAARMAQMLKGHVFHCSYDPKWDMRKYHQDVIRAARSLDKYGLPVILDRWAPSEEVYGSVFRGGPSYVTRYMIRYKGQGLVWIYCRSDHAVENHLRNRKYRQEMFDSMAQVAEAFDEYVRNTPELGWIEYDFEKVDAEEFINSLPKVPRK